MTSRVRIAGIADPVSGSLQPGIACKQDRRVLRNPGGLMGRARQLRRVALAAVLLCGACDGDDRSNSDDDTHDSENVQWLSDADAVLRAEEGLYIQEWFGASIAGGADIDGDGWADFVVGEPLDDTSGHSAGAVHLFCDAVAGEVSSSEAEAVLLGEASGDQAGQSLDVGGDVDGDGRPDILIGAPGESSLADLGGAAYLVLDPPSGTVDLAEADAKIVGTVADPALDPHLAVSFAGDLNADGYGDLLLGWPNVLDHDNAYYGNGLVFVLHGPLVGVVEVSSADAVLVGEGNSDQAGFSVSAAGDVDADGRADILVGAPFNSRQGDGCAGAGAAYLVHGPTSGTLSLADADAILYGEKDGDYWTTGDLAGWSVAGAGDVDGDGHDDLLVGAVSEASRDYQAGAAYLFHGPVEGTHSLSEADSRFYGTAFIGMVGYAVTSAGDVDADGHADLLVGAPQVSFGDVQRGAAYLFYGPLAGEHLTSDADVVYAGEDHTGGAGYSVAGVGDIDGDGIDDILVGAPGWDGSAEDLGAAYLVYGAER